MIVFQSVFRLKIYQINIFLFLKNLFLTSTHQIIQNYKNKHTFSQQNYSIITRNSCTLSFPIRDM
jgi:hypothetical protein